MQILNVNLCYAKKSNNLNRERINKFKNLVWEKNVNKSNEYLFTMSGQYFRWFKFSTFSYKLILIIPPLGNF